MTLLPDNYINTLSLLKQRIKEAGYKSLSAVNTEMILAYLDIGETISKQTESGWGTSVIDRLSIDLQAEFNGVKGFSSRNLHRMKLTYEQINKNEISPQLVAKIPWGHTSLIFSKVKDKNQQIFYIQKSAKEGWSRSILEEKISFNSYKKNLEFLSNFDKTVDSAK